MKRPWNLSDLPVYSLATYDGGRVNMNICTYASAVSMVPKRFMVAVYHHTQSLFNIEKSNNAVLQLLGTHHLSLVNVLSKKSGNTVSNMSSTRALKDVTVKHGGEYFPSAVGEVNVVNKMKAVEAVIGGEGNGGIIVPDLHYGRDALIGIALFLTHLANSQKTIKQLRNTYPDYFMSKNKIALENGTDIKEIFEKIKDKYKNQPINTEDGLKIEFDTDWVHLRTSNTEPIIRIYAESNFATTSENIAKKLMQDIGQMM